MNLPNRFLPSWVHYGVNRQQLPTLGGPIIDRIFTDEPAASPVISRQYFGGHLLKS